jgi:hypothetical protein
MAWGFRGSNSAGGTIGTNLTGVSRAFGIAVGDWTLLTLFLGVSGKTPAFSNGTWTLIRRDVFSGVEAFLYASRYNGEATTFDITWDGTSTNRAVASSAYTGGAVGSAGDPADADGTAHAGVASTTVNFDGFTPATANDLIYYAAPNGAGVAGNVSVPSGTTPAFTERVDIGFVAQGDGIQTTAVAIGNRTATLGGGVQNNLGQLFAFTLVAPPVPIAVNWLGSSSLTITPARSVAVAWAATSSYVVTPFIPVPVAVNWLATSSYAVTPAQCIAVAWAATSTFGVGLYAALAVSWPGTSTWAVLAVAVFPPTPAVRTIVARQRLLAVTAVARPTRVVAPERPLTIVADPEGARA